MVDTISIRNYKKDHYASVKEILIEGELFDKTWDAEELLEKRIAEKPDSIIVAIIDGKVLGCVYLVDDFLPFIFRLAVKKTYRKRGIGKMLVQEAVQRLKKHGHKEIALFVDNEKDELKNWYRRQGFRESSSSWVGFWKKT
jgi:ribosomal protein S18 acetylase RimI-like enzyme